MIERGVAAAPASVIGSTLQLFQWDGVGRITYDFDDIEPGHATGAASTYAHDTLGRLLVDELHSYLKGIGYLGLIAGGTAADINVRNK